MPMPAGVSAVAPVRDLVLIKVADAEEATTGGVLLPTSSQRKPTSGDVAAVGPDVKGLKKGDTVLYSKFGIGATDIEVQGTEFCLLKESDVIGTMPRPGASIEDVPELKPCQDRVLLKVEEAADETKGGVLLPSSAKERPTIAEVVRCGPGKEEDGETVDVKLKVGQRVVFFKWAGEKMNMPDGTEYNVIPEKDVLGTIGK